MRDDSPKKSKLTRRLNIERARSAAEARAFNRRSRAAKKGWQTRRKNLGLPPVREKPRPYRYRYVDVPPNEDFAFTSVRMLAGDEAPQTPEARALLRSAKLAQKKTRRRRNVEVQVTVTWIDAETQQATTKQFSRSLRRGWNGRDLARAVASASGRALLDAYNAVGDSGNITLLLDRIRFRYRA